jgi:PAS domain S-box-containing protein/putative nucleotidyltransferase with HDIG domain
MRFNKTTQFRLLILFAAIALLFFSGIILYQFKEQAQLNLLLEEENQTARQVFQKILFLKSDAIEKHVFYEYSIWDEMVKGIARNDTLWFQEQVKNGFDNYGYDFVWILDKEGNLIYSNSRRRDLSFTNPTIPAEELVPLLKKQNTNHFYTPTFLGTMEIFVASVHPSNDAGRHTSPAGYYMVGRLWDRKYVRELSLLTQTDITVIPTTPRKTLAAVIPEHTAGIIHFTKPLYNWKDEPVALLNIDSVPPWLDTYRQSSRIIFLGYFTFVLMLLAIFGIYFRRWITLPINSLQQALNQKSSAPVKDLTRESTEFGIISRMIDQFFQQEKQVLENQRYLDTLIQNLPGIVYRCKNAPKWPMVYVSEGIKILTGYEPDKFTGKDQYPYSRLIYHEDRKKVWFNIQEAVKLKQPYEVEYRIRDIKGNLKHFWERGRGVWDDSGNLLFLEGFIIDISQRVHAQKALSDKIRRLELLRKISYLVQESHDFESLIASIYQLIPQYIEADRVRAFLYVSATGNLVKAKPKVGPDSKQVKEIDDQLMTQSIGISISGICFSKNEAIAVDDCFKTDLIPPQIVEAMNLKSVLAVPIISHNKTIGVLRLDYTRKMHTFTDEEIEFSQLLGEQLGVVLENAQLLKELVESRNAIQERENRYREAIKGIKAVPYEARYYPVRYIFMGEGIKDLLGYTPEELTTEVWVKSVKEKVSSGTMKNLEPAEATRLTLEGKLDRWEMDYRMVDRMGRERWVSDTSIQLKDKSGKPYGSLGILRDITEEKEAEHELRKLTRALEQSSSGIIITDTIGRIEYINNKFSQISGYSLEEVKGKAPAIFGSGNTSQNTYDWIWETINEGNEWHGELCNRKKTGELYWADATISPIRDKDGHITHFMNSLEDVTSRKAAEKVKTVLSDLGARLTDASSSVDVSKIILEKCDTLFGWEAAFITIYSEEEKVLKDILAYDEIDGSRKQLKTKDLAKFPPLIQRTFTEGPILILRDKKDLDTDSLRLPRFGNKARLSLSLMMVPFRKHERNIGVLSIQSYRANAYTQSDLDLLKVIASYCASALERTFARQQLEEREIELERKLDFISSLRAIDMAITGSMDLRININIILQQVFLRLGAEGANVLLYDSSLNQMEILLAKNVKREIPLWTSESYANDPSFHVVRERNILQVKRSASYPYGFPRMPESVEEKFQTYIGIPLVAKAQVQGVLEIYFTLSDFEPSGEWTEFLEAMATQSAIAIDNATLFDRLQRSNTELTMAYDSTLEGWSRALDLRDKETEGHTQRVTNLTETLAKAMGITLDEMINLRWGALLHDIGKMGIPDSILLKPGPLAAEEWVIMKKHPVYAFELLSPIQYLRPALDIPYCHHEKWDGTGYPRGLKGREIPMAARIFAVVDVWDAMTSNRPYRAALPRETVLEHIKSLRGVHFDPEVADTFLTLMASENQDLM